MNLNPHPQDIPSLHFCIDFVLLFFWSWKKPTDDCQQSAPFSIFLSNICYASANRYWSMLYVRTSTFHKNRTKAWASINFYFIIYMFIKVKIFVLTVVISFPISIQILIRVGLYTQRDACRFTSLTSLVKYQYWHKQRMLWEKVI